MRLAPDPPIVPTQVPTSTSAPVNRQQATLGPWNTPRRLNYGPGALFTTQTWAPRPSTGVSGMQQVPYYPPLAQGSQGGQVVIPGTQYPGSQDGFQGRFQGEFQGGFQY
jgi:hypothetical protein